MEHIKFIMKTNLLAYGLISNNLLKRDIIVNDMFNKYEEN